MKYRSVNKHKKRYRYRSIKNDVVFVKAYHKPMELNSPNHFLYEVCRNPKVKNLKIWFLFGIFPSFLLLNWPWFRRMKCRGITLTNEAKAKGWFMWAFIEWITGNQAIKFTRVIGRIIYVPVPYTKRALSWRISFDSRQQSQIILELSDTGSRKAEQHSNRYRPKLTRTGDWNELPNAFLTLILA